MSVFVRSLDGAWTQQVRTGSIPGRPPTKIVPLVFHSVWHALGTDYGCCRDGVNIRSIYADATLCFSTFDLDLGIFHSIYTPPTLRLNSVHTPSKLRLNSVWKTIRTWCVLSASCMHTCVFHRIIVNVFFVNLRLNCLPGVLSWDLGL